MDESLEGQRQTANSWIVVAPWRMFAAVKQFILAHQAETACACLLLLMSANLLTAIARKSITNDEIVHIPAGYYHLVAGEFQLNNEHPPLIKMWAALPLLFVQPDEPPAPKTEDENFMERTWGFHERFWQANSARFQTVTFWPRVMMVPITLALGVFIFIFAGKLFGETAAVISVALYVLEPTVLAHGRIVHTDVPAAFVYLLFFFTLHYYSEASGLKRVVASGTAETGTAGHSSSASTSDSVKSGHPDKVAFDESGRVVRSPSQKQALLLGLACGVALLTKFSMLVVLPVLGIYLLAWLFLNRRDRKQRSQVLLHAGLITIVVLFLLNASYYFQHPTLEASDVRWVQLKSPALLGFVTTAVSVLSKLIPTYYLFGIYNIQVHNYYGHATSLLGQYNDLGWWYYFPLAFALKTTIPFLLLAVAALGWAVWGLLTKHNGKRDKRFLWLIVPVAIYATIALTSHINIGIRHFLPVYPFLFIAGGALLAQLFRARRLVGLGVLVILFGWMGFEAARAFPNYVPYMNQLASRHPHWYYLSDSNVEWGDDVGDLAAYLKARGETKVRAALSAGWSSLRLYDVEYLSLTSMPAGSTPETRYVAIGASELNGSTVFVSEIDGVPLSQERRVNFFARYRDRKPEAVFGGSIYLFREKE